MGPYERFFAPRATTLFSPSLSRKRSSVPPPRSPPSSVRVVIPPSIPPPLLPSPSLPLLPVSAATGREIASTMHEARAATGLAGGCPWRPHTCRVLREGKCSTVTSSCGTPRTKMNLCTLFVTLTAVIRAVEMGDSGTMMIVYPTAKTVATTAVTL